MKSLVVYFSWSGNTRIVAEEIQKQTTADIYEIKPQSSYTENYSALLDIAKKERSLSARPKISGSPTNITEYEIIFLGYPNWWGDMPMIIYTFLESYDLSGKTIAPFVTSGGSGFSRTISSIMTLAPKSKIAKGLNVREAGEIKTRADITKWLSFVM